MFRQLIMLWTGAQLAACHGNYHLAGTTFGSRQTDLLVSVVTPGVTIMAGQVKSWDQAGEHTVEGKDFTFTDVPSRAPYAPFCDHLPLEPSAVTNAITDGGIPVRVKVPQLDEPLYGILMLCYMPSSTTGPASRAYRIQVPDEYVAATEGGRTSLVYEEVEDRDSDYKHTSWQLYLSRTPFPGTTPPALPPAPKPASPQAPGGISATPASPEGRDGGAAAPDPAGFR